MESAIRTEADRLHVDVRLAGFLNQSEIGRAYAIADVLSLPSDETWGLVVNEALATGLPCVVSDTVGCAIDLVHAGETGYVHPVEDVDAQADRFDEVRRRTQNGHDWRPACRAAVAEYSFPAMTAGLIAACRAVVAPRRHVAHATRVQDVSNAH
jgi:glycosyltransferase involved in cell wall biosynthesis